MNKPDFSQDNCKLKYFDEMIFKIRSELDYQRYLTPINFAYENQKFLECYKNGEVYNPQYKYDGFKTEQADENSLTSIINALSEYNTGIGYILYKAALALSKEVLMYGNIGNDEKFSALCNEIYGTPDHSFISLANDVLDSESVCAQNGDLYTAEFLRDVFIKRIQSYGFEWQIIVSPNMASRVSVEPDQKKVYIKQGSLFSYNDIVRLQVHEIDTHILRCENGKKRGYSVLSSGTYGSLIHEEGLALYNEWKNNVQDSAISKLYASRFIACCYIDRSFYDLFDMLVQRGCNEEQAMYVVSRIKRGISDTSKPGGFIKDYVYFQGFHEIMLFLDNNTERYHEMYYGSISIADLELLDSEIKNEINSDNIMLPYPVFNVFE